jgi:hypothetical protein
MNPPYVHIKEVPNMEGAINKKDKDGGRRVNYQEINKKEGEIREKGQVGR